MITSAGTHRARGQVRDRVIDLTGIRDGTGLARLLDMAEGRSKQAFKTWPCERELTRGRRIQAKLRLVFDEPVPTRVYRRRRRHVPVDRAPWMVPAMLSILSRYGLEGPSSWEPPL